MKLLNHFFACVALGLLCFSLAGCQSERNVAHLSHGYEQVTHAKQAWLEEATLPRISFQYRDADGKVIPVWPALYGADEFVINGGLAVFVGDKAYTDPEKVTRPRLFAVKSPELPLDITDEVLWRWSKASGKDFATTLQRFNLITTEKTDGGLKLHLEFSAEGFLTVDKDWPDKSDLPLDWNQVSDIMQAVKTKGIVEKDLRWHTPYIGEKF